MNESIAPAIAAALRNNSPVFLVTDALASPRRPPEHHHRLELPRDVTAAIKETGRTPFAFYKVGQCNLIQGNLIQGNLTQFVDRLSQLHAESSDASIIDCLINEFTGEPVNIDWHLKPKAIQQSSINQLTIGNRGSDYQTHKAAATVSYSLNVGDLVIGERIAAYFRAHFFTQKCFMIAEVIEVDLDSHASLKAPQVFVKICETGEFSYLPIGEGFSIHEEFTQIGQRDIVTAVELVTARGFKIASGLSSLGIERGANPLELHPAPRET